MKLTDRPEIVPLQSIKLVDTVSQDVLPSSFFIFGLMSCLFRREGRRISGVGTGRERWPAQNGPCRSPDTHSPFEARAMRVLLGCCHCRCHCWGAPLGCWAGWRIGR